jgi:hypothetical protein
MRPPDLGQGGQVDLVRSRPKHDVSGPLSSLHRRIAPPRREGRGAGRPGTHTPSSWD